MAKQQINIKLPPLLIEALRERAATEEITLTDLIKGYCEQGLGLPRSNDSMPDLEQVYDRILTELDNRILSKVDNGIASQIPLLQEQIEQRISERILAQVAPFQKHVIELTHDIPGRIAEHIATEKEKFDQMIMRSEARLELARREAIRSIREVDVTPSMMPSESVPAPEVVAIAEPEPDTAPEATVAQEEVIPPSIQAESIPVDPPAPDPVAAQETTEDQVSAMLAEGLVALEADLLGPAPKSGVQVVKSAAVMDDGWLTAREAHAILVERFGYSSQLNYFRQLTPAQLQSLGFETDPSRKRKGDRNSRWLRLLPES